MRDWNLSYPILLWGYYPVWIEPVRDWNTDPDNWSCGSWKLCELNLWGIETVLIPKPMRLFAWCELNLWGIETLDFCFLEKQNPAVWIEPVRDWNLNWICLTSSNSLCVNWTCEGLKLKNFSCFKIAIFKCELNLWGIETVFAFLFSRSLLLCELNLWGIETW